MGTTFGLEAPERVKPKTVKPWWILVIVVCCVGFDQLTKRWADQNLHQKPDQFQHLIEGRNCHKSYTKRWPLDPNRRAVGFCRNAEKTSGGFLGTRAIVDVVEGHFEFEYVENPGAAFGLFAHDPPWWGRFYMHAGAAIGLIFLLTLSFAFARVGRFVPMLYATFAASGAIGNIWDRIQFGYVIDFIVWRVPDFRWPTFNVADACISVGFFGLLGLALVESFRLFRQRESPIFEES